MSESTSTQARSDTSTFFGSKVMKMPGIKLEISLGKDIIIRIPEMEQSYRGKIVGYDPYDYMIANVRLPSKVRNGLALGGQIIVKYILRGTVYGFKTYVHNAITSPTSLVFFEYPTVVEKFELRRETRTQCSIQGTLQTEETEQECLVINISLTGCKLSVRAGTRDPLAALKVGDTLIVFMILGVEGTLKLPIVVRNIKRERGLLILGNMFLDLNENEAERIQQYLDRMLRLTR